MKFFNLIFFLITVNIYSQIVYKTPAGKKYHSSGCRMVKNVSASLSIESAARKGLSPCGICKPPFKSVSGTISKAKETAGENSSSFCHGTTKKGSRCKRTTRIGNDFCFQHRP